MVDIRLPVLLAFLLALVLLAWVYTGTSLQAKLAHCRELRQNNICAVKHTRIPGGWCDRPLDFGVVLSLPENQTVRNTK